MVRFAALIVSLGFLSASAEELGGLELKYHLMHPGGPSAPGDPNAAFYLDGTYHLHYILRHEWEGNRSFSFVHVTSPDMLHWQWQPTKLQPAFTGHGMFSGTGFLTKAGDPAVIYHGQGSNPSRNFITLAENSELSAWKKPYAIEVKGAPEGMRHWDPDCFLIGETYYAISGGKDPSLIKSDDLKNWTYVGPFLSHEPEGVVMGEDVSCANFFPIDDPSTGGQKWLLLCISHTHGCRYYLGAWDTDREQFVPESHGRMNWPQEGQEPELKMDLRSWDFFAPESVLTPDGRRVMWSWMHSLDPVLREKTIQSLPRELSLGSDGKLRVRPLQELETLRHDLRVIESLKVSPEEENFGGLGTERILGMGDDAWEIRVRVSREEAERKRFGLRLFTNGRTEGLPITVQPSHGTLRLGNKKVPFAVADLPKGEDVELRIFIDGYLVEVFANDLVSPVIAQVEGRQFRGIDAFSWGAPTTFEKIEIWRMKSTTDGFDEACESRIWEPGLLEGL
ncbi:MAG: glycoside hydrolase family 32 protein [Verrucomicrobiota bacterium]